MSRSSQATGREFEAIFADLRALLEKYADRESLVVIDDSERRYCLAGGRHPKHKTPMPLAWVQIGKGYVSFHHMGICSSRNVRHLLSPRLKARMQGKTCFNFKTCEPAILEELDAVTAYAFAALRKAGLLP
ncbi:MAG TPA: hypothetical protein VFV83_06370 [Chthoniobacteraceae bacterium]|nr:hypothetical protein [Chthoniobacteraceae bacterium]